MEDDDDLMDFGPVTQLDHRKSEVAKFKNAKKPKKIVKQNRHRWQSFNERLDGVQVCHDSFVCVTSLIHTCHSTHSPAQYGLFMVNDSVSVLTHL